MAITTAQIRGARGILNWSQSDLAQRTGISATSIGSIENSQSTPRANTLNTIQKAFEDSGIEFIGMDGVRQRRNDVRVYAGRENFWGFYDDVYESLQQNPGEVMVSNANERLFESWLSPDQITLHTARMKALSGINYKILLREGDTYFLASRDYADYRWMPANIFASVPFYVYADKLAILLFNEEPTVIVINYPAVAESYRVQFRSMWNGARIPEQTTKEQDSLKRNLE